jgi:hypothetical protein
VDNISEFGSENRNLNLYVNTGCAAQAERCERIYEKYFFQNTDLIFLNSF